MTDEQVWELERELWLGDLAFYKSVIDDACIMAFADIGILTADAILKSLQNAPRWENVEMTSKSIGRGGRETIAVGYHAKGRRVGSEPYQCVCTSTYRKDGKRWRLIQHQQTPDDA